jgi:hypothetical protein
VMTTVAAMPTEGLMSTTAAATGEAVLTSTAVPAGHAVMAVTPVSAAITARGRAAAIETKTFHHARIAAPAGQVARAIAKARPRRRRPLAAFAERARSTRPIFAGAEAHPGWPAAVPVSWGTRRRSLGVLRRLRRVLAPAAAERTAAAVPAREAAAGLFSLSHHIAALTIGGVVGSPRGDTQEQHGSGPRQPSERIEHSHLQSRQQRSLTGGSDVADPPRAVEARDRRRGRAGFRP